MSDAGPEPEQNEDAEPDQAREEARRKFREALDRKRAKQTDGDGGRAGTDPSQLHRAHDPARSRRSFRRKSG